MTGVIAAMPQELDAVLAHMAVEEEKEVGKVRFYKGKLEGQEIVIALAGVGEMSAAMAAGLLCALYHPDVLINVGVAGGLHAQQHPGDLVIGSEVVQADFDTSPIDGDKGVGQRFEADPQLVSEMEAVAKELEIPARTGLIATQDIFMARDVDYFALMEKFPQSLASEMEGAAVAFAASRFEVPFVVLRTLSDVVHHEDNPMEFENFARKSADRAAMLLKNWAAMRSGINR